MSISRLWAFLAIALPMLASLLAPMSTVDLAYHLRAGSTIMSTGRIPTADSWTFTAYGQPWFDQQWGAQLILAAVEHAAGWAGLAIVRAGLVGFIFGSLVAVARVYGIDRRLAALLSLAAFVVSSPGLALRPQLLGMACFALVLFLVVDRPRRPTRIVLVPVVIAIWANLHGSFVFGPLVLGLAWVEDFLGARSQQRRTLAALAASLVAASLTPFGPQVWSYAAGLSTAPLVTSLVSEWQPTSLRDGAGALLFVSIAVVGAICARSDQRVPWPTLGWFATFAAIGIYAQRGVPWWAMASVAIASSVLPMATGTTRQPRLTVVGNRVNAAFAVGLIVLVLLQIPAWRSDPVTGVPSARLVEAPTGLSAALRDVAKPGDRVFNSQRLGSWIEYAMPDLLVAVDSRIELFSADTWRAYLGSMAGELEWQGTFNTWGVSLAVLEAPDSALAARLESAGWRQVYRAVDGSIYQRPDAEAAYLTDDDVAEVAR